MYVHAYTCMYTCAFRYGECIVLLLPLLEHGMRCLYCLANHCHNRLLTAEVCTASKRLHCAYKTCY